MRDDEERTGMIRDLNDSFRRTGAGGKVFLTRGIAALSEVEKQELISRIRLFDDFNEENDPYGEHDFAALPIGDYKAYFKIDYYNADMSGGSEDPADLCMTTRVMTIMYSHEY